ncbi:ATP-binding protein [Photobacterium leiognathi]|uniref:ATP-binding protein n=1 Tax=Photobacterium leiognathi TaxID=553611 RepID=UPI0027372BFF|nr:ATP-binding protein [Photobacterium leiognathi]
MNLLKSKVERIIKNIKDNGDFPNENNHLDYKVTMNLSDSKKPHEVFLMNFAKDIISFANSDGGIVLLGIKENKSLGIYEDSGLYPSVIETLDKIDLNDVSQAIEKIIKTTIMLDLQKFKISTRTFYYILIEKSNQVIIPILDAKDCKIYKGNIYYRMSGKNEQANKSTTDFNRFLQLKANEKSKEFMEIWSKLMPELFEINPREVLILNPLQNKVYGFNGKDNILSKTDVEIDKNDDGVFNIILNAISAGEIGKITTNEGKPLYKIVGEIVNDKDRVSLSNIEKAVKKETHYKFSNAQLKEVIAYLGWVNNASFKINDPEPSVLCEGFSEYIWLETVDSIKESKKITFSKEAVKPIVEVINNSKLHKDVFKKDLALQQ